MKQFKVIILTGVLLFFAEQIITAQNQEHLLNSNSTFSQSDTVRWGKYLHIKTRLSNPPQYLYEYQDTMGNIMIPKGKYSLLGKPDEYGFINAWRESTNSKDLENNVGFIDIHENILIPFHYSRLFSFKHNLACASKNGKIGYINRKGETVIPFLYNSREDFYDDGVVVIKKGKKEVLIDTLGNEIIDENHPYQEIKENFPHDHILLIQKNEKWAFFGLNGKPLTPFIFDEIHPANICPYQPNLWYGKRLRWFYKGLTVVEKDNEFAVLNEKMEYVIPFGVYQWISPVSVGGIMIVKQDNLFGLLNHQLEFVQPIKFDTITNSPANDHEQNFPSFLAKQDDKYFIFDTLGKWTYRIEYDDVAILQANFYLVTKDGKQSRVDRNGTPIIEDFLIIREEGDGFVARKDSLFGLIDFRGEIILPFEYEDIVCEHLGNIFVKKNGKWGVVDNENLQLLMPYKYDYITYAWDESEEDRNYMVVQNDKFGKVTQEGKLVFPCIYDGITTWVEYGPDGHYVMIDNKMGLIDCRGNVVIPIQYEKVTCLWGTNWAMVFDKGKIGLFDIKNRAFFLPLEYDFLSVIYDEFGFENIPTRIITYQDGIVNILNEKRRIIQSNVSKTEIKNEFEIDLDAYQFSPCSYELLMMIHNKTFQAPDCLLETLKEFNSPVESIYYKMGENE